MTIMYLNTIYTHIPVICSLVVTAAMSTPYWNSTVTTGRLSENIEQVNALASKQ